jgi:hypothetical protein
MENGIAQKHQYKLIKLMILKRFSKYQFYVNETSHNHDVRYSL